VLGGPVDGFFYTTIDLLKKYKNIGKTQNIILKPGMLNNLDSRNLYAG